MKKTAILLISFLMLASTEAFSQIPVNLIARDRVTGEVITINYVLLSGGQMTLQTAPDTATGKTVSFVYTDLRKYDVTPYNIESLWQIKMLESQVYEDLLKSGYYYNYRYAMDELMKDFLSTAQQNNAFYIDSYLETRLYGILRMVYPLRHSDKRPGILSLRILSDIQPDAWVGPDGTMIITTGMITAVNSEVELMALMAQVVAHYALDHYLKNYYGWLNTGIEPALGNCIRYNPQQELAADMCVISVMRLYGQDPSVLASVFRKVLNAGRLMGNYYLGTTQGLFPGAFTRAASYPDTIDCYSADYERLIAPVISFNAFSAYNQSQYLLCQRLLERNIASGEASADDLVLLSQAMMNLAGSDAEDEDALAVVRSVIVRMAEPLPSAFRQEALLLLKLERRSEAEAALDKYEAALGNEEQKYKSMEGDWSQTISYLAAEKEWVISTRRR